MSKIVLDTNVLIDGVKDLNSNAWLIIQDVIDGNLDAYCSEKLRREYQLIINQEIRDVDYLEKLKIFMEKINFVELGYIPQVIEDDPEDNKVLATAVESGSEYLITEDRHLLKLDPYENIRILRAAEFNNLRDKGSSWSSFAKMMGIGGIVLLIFMFSFNFAMADDEENQSDTASQIKEKQSELKDLEAKIGELKKTNSQKEQEKTKLNKTINILGNQITQTKLELDKTGVNIDETRLRIKMNLEDLQVLEIRMNNLKKEMENILRMIGDFDRSSLWESLLKEGTFTEFLQSEQSYHSLQSRVMNVMTVTEDTKKAKQKKEDELKEKQEELQQFQKLQEVQKQSLTYEENQNKTQLKKTAAEQAKVKSEIAEAVQAREEIQQQIFTLRNAGINISLSKAEEMAKYAERLTGVRAELLLGVLKVESNLGTNVGSGRYPDDIHPDHREAFVRVMKKLGLPLTSPVSKKPTNYSGWGGALGPGQIMPGNWERIEPTVASLTGQALPSPYNLQDAFVATAVILQGNGAAAGREYEAVNRYFAGGNWQRFTWYGDRVLAVAREYEGKI